MPDWRALTAEQLAGLRLPDEDRRQQVVQELSEHLEDEFDVLRPQVSDEEAERRALALLAERDVLIREIRKAEKEDAMTQAARLFLCGIVTGVTAFLLATAAFVLVGGEFVAAVQTARGALGSEPEPDHAEQFLLHLAAGVWVMWHYTNLRLRYGAGSRTALLAGAGLWLIGCLAATVWVSLGFLPARLVVIAALVGLPAWILGAMAGAWPYELTSRRPSQALKVS